LAQGDPVLVENQQPTAPAAIARNAFLSVAIAAEARDPAIHRPLRAAFFGDRPQLPQYRPHQKVHILASGTATRRNRLSVISPVVCLSSAFIETRPAQARGSGAQPSHTAGNKWRRSLVFTHAEAKQLSLSAGHCGPYQEIQT
jgi:hypothetical protein